MILHFNNKKIPVTFVNKNHEDAYNKAVKDLEGAEGPFTLPLLFILTASAVTRAHLWEILDPAFPRSDILPECLTANWMTDEARLLVALAARVSCATVEDRAARGTLLPTVVDALAWADILYEIYGDTEEDFEWV